MTLISSRLDPLREDQPLSFCEPAYRLESFRLQRGIYVESRTRLRTREQRANTASRCGADHDRPAAWTQQTKCFAECRDTIFCAHRADETARVVDHGEISGGVA